MDGAVSTPFFFRARYGEVNWSKLRTLDIDRIIGDVDLDSLQSLLDNLTFAAIKAPDDGGTLAVKGMKIQQLVVEYLLNVQESINANEMALKGELRAAAGHVANLDTHLHRLQSHNKMLKRELKMYTAVVKTCENMLTYYGLDSAEIFLAARAAANHYGANPPAPFAKEGVREEGLGPAISYIEKETTAALNSIPSSSYSDSSSLESELQSILARLTTLKHHVQHNTRLVPPPKHDMSGSALPPVDAEPAPESSTGALSTETIAAPVLPPPTVLSPDGDRPYTTPRPDFPDIQQGRFILTVVSADNVTGKDSTLQPYLKLKLGATKISDTKSKSTKTKTAPKAAAGGLVNFSNEKLSFNIHSPPSLPDKNGKVFLSIDMYDDNYLSDPVIAHATLDVTDLLHRPFFYNDGPLPVTLDLHKPGSTVDNGTLTVKIEYWAARMGVFQLTAHSGAALYDTGNMLDTQDPYVYLTLGDAQASRSSTHNNGGTTPDFNGEELLIYVEDKTWHLPLTVEVWDDDLGADDLIGKETLNLLHLMAENGSNTTAASLPLFTKSNKPAGNLINTAAFHPFGSLTVIIHSAKHLRNPDAWGKPDPYIAVALDQLPPMSVKALTAAQRSDKKNKETKKAIKDTKKMIAHATKLACITKQTQTIDSTLDPEWLAELEFPVVDGNALTLTCYDEDIGSDDVIGTATVSLDEVFKDGKMEAWVPLSHTTKKGTKEAGDVKVQLAFWGPPGFKYPRRHGPNDKTFDDKQRENAGRVPPTASPFSGDSAAKYLETPTAMEAKGILRVVVVDGQNLKGKDKNLNAYVQAKVGPVKKATVHRSKNVKCTSSDGSSNADWSNEPLDISLDDMFKLEEGGEVNLTLSLLDDNYMKDTVLGTVIVPLKENYISKPGMSVTTTFDLTPAAGSGKVQVTISFLKATTGAVLFTLSDAKNLGNRAGMFSSAKNMDPYVYIKSGKKTKQSQTVNNGGKTPNFNNEEMLMYCDDQSWKQDVDVSVYDDNVGSDALIGTTSFSLLNLMNPADRSDADAENAVQSYSLQHKGKGSGELRMGVRYLPAGKLTVKCVSGRNLRNPDSFGKADPYIELAVESQIKPQGDQKFKTKTHSDGGGDPQWNFDCEMDIIDQYEISVKCLDKDMMSSDLIGESKLSLLELFESAAESENSTATIDVWLPLAYDAGKKGKMPAGDVHLILYFVGALGTTYPLYRPTITGDTAGMDGEDAGKEIGQAGDVLNVTPVKSMAELQKTPASLTDIRRGQLCVTLHHGAGIKGQDSSLQCYVIAKVCGATKGAFKKKSQTTKKVTEGDPQFTDEKILFNIIDIEKLKTATKNDGESYPLTLEVYDDNYLSDKCLGTCVVDLKDLLLRPTMSLNADFELGTAGAGGAGVLNATVQFLASYPGIVKMTLIEGRDLPNQGGMMDTQDPYVKVTLEQGKKDQKRKGRTVNDGGINPSFKREQMLLWCADEPGEKGLKSWTEPMKIEIFDEDTISDDLIGSTEIDILEYAAIAMGATPGEGVTSEVGGEGDEGTKKKGVDIVVMRRYPLQRNGKPGGQLIAIIEFLPAASLEIVCKGGKNLKNPNYMGTADPYLQLTSKGLIEDFGSFDVRSKTHNGGGKTPQWGNEVLSVDIADHTELIVKCWDDDLGSDDLIGEGKVSLSDVYEAGFLDRWVPLAVQGKPAGEVHVSFHARNPAGISAEAAAGLVYPVCRDGIKDFKIPSVAGGGFASPSRSESGVISSPLSPKGVHGGAMLPSKTWKQQKGTVKVKIFELDDIRGKNTKLQLSVRLRLGAETPDFEHKTKTTGATEGGILFPAPHEFEFDCFNPEALVQEDDLVIIFEVAEKTGMMGTKTVVAEKHIIINSCLAVPNKELVGSESAGEGKGQWFELDYAGDDDTNGRVRMSVHFEAAKTGMLIMNMKSCADLKASGGIFDKKIDPYIKLKVGKTKVRGKTYKDTEQSYELKESDTTKNMIVWCDEKNYFDDAVVQVWDDNIGSDTLLGEHTINLMQLMDQGAKKDNVTYHLSTGKKGKETFKGTITIQPSFHAAGMLVLQVISGKDLRSTEVIGKNDPYVVVEMGGSVGGKEANDKQQTQTIQGSNDPEWNSELTFLPCDHKEMKFKVMDDDTLADDEIGSCVFDLSEVYRLGVVDKWLDLSFGKKKTPSGSVHVVFTFWGAETMMGTLSSGIETRYPCCQADEANGGVATFGDSERINVIEKLELGGGGSLTGKFDDVKLGAAPPASVMSEMRGGRGGGGGRPQQAFGSCMPGEEKEKVMVKGMTEVEIKMDKLKGIVGAVGEKEVGAGGKVGGISDAPVFDIGAKYIHAEDQLVVERSVGERMLREKVSRFGVSDKGGIEDGKMAKKMSMLERARKEDYSEKVNKGSKKIGEVVDGAIGEILGAGGEVDMSNAAAVKQAKDSVKEEIISGMNVNVNANRMKREDSVHMDGTRQGIEFALSELPKQSDFDHSVEDEGDKAVLNVEKTVSGIYQKGAEEVKEVEEEKSTSVLLAAVMDLPVKSDFTRRSESVDEGQVEGAVEVKKVEEMKVVKEEVVEDDIDDLIVGDNYDDDDEWDEAHSPVKEAVAVTKEETVAVTKEETVAVTKEEDVVEEVEDDDDEWDEALSPVNEVVAKKEKEMGEEDVQIEDDLKEVPMSPMSPELGKGLGLSDDESESVRKTGGVDLGLGDIKEKALDFSDDEDLSDEEIA